MDQPLTLSRLISLLENLADSTQVQSFRLNKNRSKNMHSNIYFLKKEGVMTAGELKDLANSCYELGHRGSACFLSVNQTDSPLLASDILITKASVITKDLPLNKASPLQVQIGGDHYKNCKIQPVEFIEANDLGFLEGCVLKRVTRHNKSTGKGRQDIEKAIHELNLLLELRYKESGI